MAGFIIFVAVIIVVIIFVNKEEKRTWNRGTDE